MGVASDREGLASVEGSEAGVDTSDFNCPICWHLLLDPVVAGCCGNDFCKHCYEKWVNGEGFNANCPICRQPLLRKAPGVCKRLASQIEAKFPDELEKRRQHVKADLAARKRERDGDSIAAQDREREHGGRVDDTGVSGLSQQLLSGIASRLEGLRSVPDSLHDRLAVTVRGDTGYPSVASVAGLPPLLNAPTAFQRPLDSMGLRPDGYNEASLPSVVRSAPDTNPQLLGFTFRPSTVGFIDDANDRFHAMHETLGMSPQELQLQQRQPRQLSQHRPWSEGLSRQEFEVRRLMPHPSSLGIPTSQRQAWAMHSDGLLPNWRFWPGMANQIPSQLFQSLDFSQAALPHPSQLRFTMGAIEDSASPGSRTRRLRTGSMRRAHPVMRRRIPGAHA